jgi:tetratricopeptide (TPR) repeat protein
MRRRPTIFRPLAKVLLASLLLTFPARADGGPTVSLPLSAPVRSADDYYLGRQNLGNVQRGLQLLRERVAREPNDYEAWWRIAKFVSYVARHAPDDRKLSILSEGVNAGRRAVALAPARVEGHFWLGANLGLSAEEGSFIRGISLIDNIRREMEIVNQIDPDYEQASGLRTLARVDFRAPFFKGGNKRRSVELLEKCLTRYPDNSFTMLYLAESYLAVGLRDEARKQLESILTLCPDPVYGPELADNQTEARRMLAEEFHSGK